MADGTSVPVGVIASAPRERGAGRIDEETRAAEVERGVSAVPAADLAGRAGS